MNYRILNENRGHHSDLDMRQSPQTWFYSEVVEKIIEQTGTIYRFRKSGTITGISEKELFGYMEKYAPYVIYQSLNGNTENRLLSNLEKTILIEVEVNKRGRALDTADIMLASNNKEIRDDILKWLKKHLTIANGNTVYCVGQTSHGLTLQDIGKINDKLIRHNYHQDILDKLDYTVEQLNSNKPNGRLSIINGEPGVGKTTAIKGIIPQIKNGLVILLPTRLIGEVDGPALVSLLAEWKSEYGYDHTSGESTNPAIILILEDADECLTTRNDANMSTVSSVLNHTDGIFGSMLDLRLVATTNAKQIEFDKAFTRPGRLCTHITIGKLEIEHAMEIYERITGEKKKYKKQMTLAEIYADANDNPYGFIEEEKKLGFNI